MCGSCSSTETARTPSVPRRQPRSQPPSRRRNCRPPADVAITPTQLTLRDLRGEGWTAEVVEHYNVFTKTRHDLFNIIDIVALRGGTTLGGQATSATNVAARIRKIAEHPNTPALRQA